MSLKDKFPRLYEINEEQSGSVATIKMRNWWLTFRRWLSEDPQNHFRRLHDILYRCNANNEKNKAKWDWEKSRTFLLNQCINIYVERIRDKTLNIFDKPKSP